MAVASTTGYRSATVGLLTCEIRSLELGFADGSMRGGVCADQTDEIYSGKD